MQTCLIPPQVTETTNHTKNRFQNFTLFLFSFFLHMCTRAHTPPSPSLPPSPPSLSLSLPLHSATRNITLSVGQAPYVTGFQQRGSLWHIFSLFTSCNIGCCYVVAVSKIFWNFLCKKTKWGSEHSILWFSIDCEHQ